MRTNSDVLRLCDGANDRTAGAIEAPHRERLGFRAGQVLRPDIRLHRRDGDDTHYR